MARSSATIEELKRERGNKKVCVLCDEPLSGKQRVLCADPECTKEYNRTYHMDVRTNMRHRPLSWTQRAFFWGLPKMPKPTLKFTYYLALLENRILKGEMITSATNFARFDTSVGDF